MPHVIVDELAERKYGEVIQDTWGHLAPEKRQVYKGYIIYTYDGYGDTTILDVEFEGLDSSPWLCADVGQFLSDVDCDEVGLYKWQGNYMHGRKEHFTKGKTEYKSFTQIFSAAF
jgi:hypothetical protein